jgi:hypothetical protein
VPAVLPLAVPAAVAAAAAATSSQVQLVVPPAQSVAVEAVRLAAADVPPVLRLADRRAPAATAMIALKTEAGSTTMFAVTVSRGGDTASMGLAGAAALARKDLPDIGTASPAARSSFSKNIRKLLGWDPLGSPDDLAATGVTLRLYDARHPAGRPLDSASAVASARDAAQLLIEPNLYVRDDLYKQIDAISSCILGHVQCGDFEFTFSGLQETLSRSDDPNYRLTTNYSGRTCGRTLTGQAWRVTYQSGSSRPVATTIDLRKRNIVFVTRAKIKRLPSVAVHKLGVQEGAFPVMDVLVEATGGWRSNSGALSVPVKIAKLAPGKRC